MATLPAQDAVPFPQPPRTDATGVSDDAALVPDAATPAPPSSQPRYPHVDALRAIAALLVVWGHTTETFSKLGLEYLGGAIAQCLPTAGQWMNEASTGFNFGRIGVVLFFAVSGFVIPASLKGGRLAGLRRFAISRFFRLYPAYWLSIPFGFLTFYWLWGTPFSWRDAALNLTMVPELLGAQPAEGLYWTLATELLFYGTCALLYAVGGLRRVRVIAALALLLFLVCIKYRAYPQCFLAVHLSIMFFGTLCRYYLESDRQALRSRLLGLFILGYALVCAVLPLVAAYKLQAGRWPEFYYWITRSYAIGIGLFCIGLTAMRIRWRFAAWMGEISYSLYLLHPAVMYALLWALLRWAPAGLYGLHQAWYLLAVAALTVLVSALNYHYLEKPAIRLGKYLAHRTPANVARATTESFP